MGYFDILKRAFDVTNRNLLALFAQFLLWVALIAVIGVFAVIFAGMAAGSLSGLDFSTFSPDIIWEVVKSSVRLLFVGAVMLLAVVVLSFILSAFVQAGILGCLIDTARYDTPGFTSSSFFSSARRSAFPLLWFYIIWSLIAVGVIGFIVLAGAAGFYAVLIPMRDAGSQFGAFVIGVPLLVVLIILFILSLFLIYSGGILSSVTLVGERKGAFSAIGSAYDFVKENFWDTMLFTLLVIFVSFAANMVSELVTLPMKLSVQTGGIAVAVLTFAVIVVMMVFQMYVALFGMSCFVVFYLDRTKPPAPIVPVVRPAATPPVPAQTPPLPAEGQGEEDILDAGPPGEDAGFDLDEWKPEPLDSQAPPKDKDEG